MARRPFPLTARAQGAEVTVFDLAVDNGDRAIGELIRLTAGRITAP